MTNETMENSNFLQNKVIYNEHKIKKNIFTEKQKP